jgi:hypothetical protein
MKWAKSLILVPGESIENRLENVLKGILKEFGNMPCIISLIDATGQAGNALTKRNNNGEHIQTDVKNMIFLAQEDGQIFDLDLSLNSDTKLEILVTVGQHIDIVGEAHYISSIIGEHIELDPQLFDD